MEPTKSVNEKKCFRCGIVRKVSEFSKDKQRNDGLAFYCRLCKKELKQNVTPQQHRINNYKHLYGMTVDDYDKMLLDQGGKCAICGSSNPGRNYNYFAVDHNHTTGQVRALLCTRCNTALGMWDDQSNLLDAAAAYLRKYQ
jgi:transcription elongation factor Elf1